MCGLVGMAGNFIDADKKAFRNLLRFDVVRGEHSTGVATVDKGSEMIHLYKKVGAPDLLFSAYEDFELNGTYKGPDAKLFIGHNRYATKGAVTDDNAHPFYHGGIVGAHNGTLDTVFGLKDGNKFAVDSEAIFYTLSQMNDVEAISNIDGAYALTWYDANENKLKVIRNKERPLHWCRRKDSDVIYWASMPWMLELALAYANVTHTDVIEFNKDTLYSLDLDFVDNGKAKDMKWSIKQNVKGKEWASSYTYNGNSAYYNGYNQQQKAGTVHPFKGANSSQPSPNSSADSGLTKKELVQWGAWEGKDIEFKFSEVKDGMNNIKYLSAYPEDTALGFNLRIFGEKNEKWEEWKNSRHTKVYIGKVKKFVRYVTRGKKEHYLAIDLRTIREKPTKSDDKEGYSRSSLQNDHDQRFYEGYRGDFLTHKEWCKATKNGCSGCSSTADEDDDELTWLADDAFLCGDCSQSGSYNEYIIRAYNWY